MAFISAKDIAGTNNPTRHHHIRADVVFACYTQKHNESYALSFKLSNSLCKIANIKPGDRLDVLFDKDCNMALLRKSSNGWTASGKRQSETDAPLYVKIIHRPGMPSIAKSSACQDVEVRRDGIYFMLPENTSWADECIRCDQVE